MKKLLLFALLLPLLSFGQAECHYFKGSMKKNSWEQIDICWNKGYAITYKNNSGKPPIQLEILQQEDLKIRKLNFTRFTVKYPDVQQLLQIDFYDNGIYLRKITGVNNKGIATWIPKM